MQGPPGERAGFPGGGKDKRQMTQGMLPDPGEHSHSSVYTLVNIGCHHDKHWQRRFETFKN